MSDITFTGMYTLLLIKEMAKKLEYDEISFESIRDLIETDSMDLEHILSQLIAEYRGYC